MNNKVNIWQEPPASPKEIWDFLDALGKNMQKNLGEYQGVIHARFNLGEIDIIQTVETYAIRYAAFRFFGCAADRLSATMELQIKRTYDLIPEDRWKQIVPEVGEQQQRALITFLNAKNAEHLIKLLTL